MTGGQNPRVLVIGLDGATFRIIKPMIEAGELPALRRLIEDGTHGVLRSTIQPSSEQAWSTFMTGVQNGKHGIYGFVQRVPGSYDYEYTNAHTQRGRTLWRILSDSGSGRPVIAVNVPMTYPPEPVNGVLVGGLMTPSERSRFTYPPDLYEELKREVGGYTINVDIETGRLQEAGEEQLLHEIEEMMRQRSAAVKYLAHTRDWDLLSVVYGAGDRVSHKFWKYMDQEHPTLQAGKGGVIPRVYSLLDEEVGELVSELADERTLVLLVSDHGFGPLKKAFFLNQWLSEHGYLAFKEREVRDWGTRLHGWVNAGLRQAVHWLDRPWMGAAKRAAFDLLPGLKGRMHSSMAYAKVDWMRTRAYGSGTMGNIYLNVRGREPQGIVEQGEEYEVLRSHLIEELKSLRDPDTGAPVFEEVYRREDIYHGPYLELAPDVVGLLDPTYHIAAVDWRPAGGDVITSLEDQLLFVGDLTGQHDMDGILIAYGSNVRRGAVVEGAGIIDIAPTILAVLGEPIPEEMDGSVVNELFIEEIATISTIAGTGDEPSSQADAGDGYSDEEAEEVAARLRGLGYID